MQLLHELSRSSLNLFKSKRILERIQGRLVSFAQKLRFEFFVLFRLSNRPTKLEKLFSISISVCSVILFYAGMAFAFYLVFPLIFSFFITSAPSEISVMTDISQYLDFVITILLAFGFAFEMPILILAIIWSGLASRESLSRARPYVIIGCFVVGMLLTPPDVISQTLLAVPTWILFELGLFVSRFIKK